jgi:hypothetical protein
MNHPGEIRTLVGIARPDIRVWTNVGDAHVGFFGSVDAIADAKAEILEGATADTVLVANADDDRIVARISAFAGRVVTFGIERRATVRAETVVDRGIAGMSARVATPLGPQTIFIDAPPAGTLVGSPLQLKGRTQRIPTGGQLGYQVLDPASEVILEFGRPGLVLPGVPHFVEPLGPMRMQIEFYNQLPDL